MSLEAGFALLALVSIVGIVAITENAGQPVYSDVYEYQLLEDVLEVASKKPELFGDAGGISAIGREIGRCMRIEGAEYGCECGGLGAVSSSRIVRSGTGFRRISARLCRG